MINENYGNYDFNLVKIREEFLSEEIKGKIENLKKKNDVQEGKVVKKVKTWFGKDKKNSKFLKIINDEDELNLSSDIVFSEFEDEKKEKRLKIEGQNNVGNMDNNENIDENDEKDKKIKFLEVIDFISEKTKNKNNLNNIDNETNRMVPKIILSEDEKNESSQDYFFENSHEEIENYKIKSTKNKNNFYSASDYNTNNLVKSTSDKRRKWNDIKDNQSALKGKFTREETKKVVKAITRYAFTNDLTYDEILEVILSRQVRKSNPFWPAIASALPNRSIKSINDFCHRLLSPYNNKGKWSDEEIQSLIRSYEELGPRWRLIGEILNRHPENVRDKWKNIYKKKEKKEHEHVEKPWNLIFVLKFLKYINQEIIEKEGMKILKFGYKFTNMFKDGDLEGDRYIDDGEELVFLDSRIKNICQKAFVYDVVKDLLDIDNIRLLILREKLTADFNFLFSKFNLIETSYTLEDLKKKFEDFLKYFEFDIDHTFKTNFQFLERMLTDKNNRNCDNEKLASIIQLYFPENDQIKIDSEEPEEDSNKIKIKIIIVEAIKKWNKSKLYLHLTKNKINVKDEKNIKVLEEKKNVEIKISEIMKQEDNATNNLLNQNENKMLNKKIQKIVSKDNLSVRLKPLKINLQEIINKYKEKKFNLEEKI